MAVVTNALQTYTLGWPTTNGVAGNANANFRETVADVLVQLTPEETPTLQVLPNEEAPSLYWDWETDRLRAKSTTQAVEGQTYVGQSLIQRKRLGNYVQHFQGDYSVTLDNIKMSQRGKTIGVKDELRYQAGKEASAQMIDVNYRCWAVAGSSAAATDAPSSGESGTGPLSGNFHYWARNSVATATSAFLGATQKTQFKYTSGSFSSGDINLVNKAMYDNGVRPDTIAMSHGVKLQFDAAIFGQTASGTLVRNTDAFKNASWDAVVDIIKTSIGRFAVMVDHLIPESSATNATAGNRIYNDAAWYMFKRGDLSLSWWRHFEPYEVPQLGDALGGYVRGSCGFKVKSPFSIGGVYGVTVADAA